MEKQLALQDRLGTNFSEMTLEERAEFMRNHRGYLADELAEALYEMPYYKLWKDYSNMTEEEIAVAWQKVRMELIDCLHFFVNLLLCAGMTPGEVHAMYMAKNKENHRRQDTGYTADVMYRDQAVEDVMGTKDQVYCTVGMDGETYTGEDFIAIITKADGDHSMFYNTDPVTIGIAIKMLTERFDALMQEYSDDDRRAICEVLQNG
jgi:dimeric dUTPase (all-alpha-NTP-PPase superfamily)